MVQQPVLPDDVWEKIIRALSPDDRRAMSSTSQHVRRLCKSTCKEFRYMRVSFDSVTREIVDLCTMVDRFVSRECWYRVTLRELRVCDVRVLRYLCGELDFALPYTRPPFDIETLVVFGSIDEFTGGVPDRLAILSRYVGTKTLVIHARPFPFATRDTLPTLRIAATCDELCIINAGHVACQPQPWVRALRIEYRHEHNAHDNDEVDLGAFPNLRVLSCDGTVSFDPTVPRVRGVCVRYLSTPLPVMDMLSVTFLDAGDVPPVGYTYSVRTVFVKYLRCPPEGLRRCFDNADVYLFADGAYRSRTGHAVVDPYVHMKRLLCP